MKVKVSYTVDYDDVPAVVNKILTDCQQSLECESRKIKFLLHNFPKMMEQINGVRDTLLTIDTRLQDALDISAGWLSVPEHEAEELNNDKPNEISED